MANTTEYKTFTLKVDSGTELGRFTTSLLTGMAEQFAPIETVAKDYFNELERHGAALQKFKDFEPAANRIKLAVANGRALFADFARRLDYFSVVMFGAVSAGKTSLICDVLNVTPQRLNDLLRAEPGYVAGKDDVQIAEGVATINMYEMLIRAKKVRLVDVPGIGGVVHDDGSIAPFVEMADCVVFLLSATADITKNDYDFLYDHVARLRQARDQNVTKVEGGYDKRVIVAFNKWGTTYRDVPPDVADLEFDRKRNWVLNGGEVGGGKFPGVAGLFAHTPTVVRTNTSRRDERTGEPYPSSLAQRDLGELVDALEECLKEDGSNVRLRKPISALEKHLNGVRDVAQLARTEHSLDDLLGGLQRIGIKIDTTHDRLVGELASRLNMLEQHIAYALAPQLKSILRGWSPKVGFGNMLKASFGAKETVQDELKGKWAEELRLLLQQQLSMDAVRMALETELKSLGQLIHNSFRAELLDNPKLALHLEKSRKTVQADKASQVDAAGSLRGQLEKAIKLVEDSLVHDLLGIVKFDAILYVLLSAILTPVGSALLMVWRRAGRARAKELEVRDEMEKAADVVAREVAGAIRRKLDEAINDALMKSASEIGKALKLHQGEIEEPLNELKRLGQTIEKVKASLSSLLPAEIA